MTLEPDVETIEIKLFLEAIYSKYGYDLRDYAPASMRRRVMAALARSGLSNLGELQHKILHDNFLFTTVLEDLTVRVSEMFRDPTFYEAFRAKVVPLLRTYPIVKIWHSGCATGEEVYATAIVLHEEGLYNRSQIYATDVSLRALDQAKNGIYSERELRIFEENYEKAGGKNQLSSYYTSAYGRFAMAEMLREHIHFFQHNLVSDHVFGEMQVVFCRNVLIYFGESLRLNVMQKFRQSLCPGGFLCLGKSEALRKSDQDFTDFVVRERIYRRR